MSVYKRESHWHYYFRVRGVRYRGVIPEARTKWEALTSGAKIKQEIFEGRYGLVDLGTISSAISSRRFSALGQSQQTFMET